MAIRITTTHIWTKLFIPIIWISRVLLICLFIAPLEWIGAEGAIEIILGVIGFLGALIIHGLFIEQFYHIIQSYLYVRVSLDTKINLQDARYLMLLFAPSEIGKWYPMKGIRELPKDIRRQALMDSAKKIYQEIGRHPPEPEKQDAQTSNRSTSQQYSEVVMDGFSDLVSMLCKLAKADNQISREEIDIIESFFMTTLQLNTEQRKVAIQYFNEAKQSYISFEVYVRRFFNLHRDNKDLLEVVCTLLTNVALADGVLSAEEEILINQAISIFEVPGHAYHSFKETYRRKSHDGTSDKEKAYAKVLGLDGELTYEKIRQSYRRLAQQYHPDKVAHLGVKMKELAENEMKLINEAYEYLKSKYTQKGQPAFE